MRSGCDQVIVLAFHHDSLLQEVAAAEHTVAAAIAEEWVAPYQRPLLGVQLRTAVAVGGARGAGLEELCAGFAQRAVRC